jgi:serine phosphatase RsbU (regulator of sigma subunit)
MVADQYSKDEKDGQLTVMWETQESLVSISDVTEPGVGNLRTATALACWLQVGYNGSITRSVLTTMGLQPDLELQVAVAKVSKYAVSESGDTVEQIERPHGGLSLVLVDGQRSGRSAKAISNIVARKAVSLLADGVRDGAAARAAHDYLRTLRGGQVSATLNIVSVDLVTRSIVISRNSHCPAIVVHGQAGTLRLLDEPSQAIGIHARTRPVITELPITPDLHIVVYTDGLLSAGERYGEKLDAPAFARETLAACPRETCARALANTLLARAVELDRGRPCDDISVLVVSVVTQQQPDHTRRLSVRFPI